MKYLGLDIGKKNIGVAIGEVLASELTTLRSGKDENFYHNPARTRAYEQIDTIINQENVDAIVIGLPVNQEEEMTPEAILIKNFGEGLSEVVNCQIHYVNETLTSFMAEELLEARDPKSKEVRARVDQVAAELILQQYLEENATL